ncbi:MAG: site-specific integrase [Rhodobacteraceae bacterium]|nr:site-specific integrase [Paracoccaceae bacterium]
MNHLHDMVDLECYHSGEALRLAARSKNTQVAYEKGWQCFVAWSRVVGLVPHEATSEDIVRFLVAMATKGRGGKPLALNTLRLYRSALNDRWRRMGSMSPASAQIVGEVLQGIARLRGDTPRRVKALREYQVLAMLKKCENGLHGIRDAAVLSLGFAAALRRSELCNLRTEDLERKVGEGLMIHLRKSKTDQQGTGQQVAVIEGNSIKPVEQLERWLQASCIREGFVFQTLLRGGVVSGRPLDSGEVARVVKRHAKRIGLNPREYSGHSLRAGFVTSAAVHRARIDKIMEVTRHRSAETVLKYVRDEESFSDHAGATFL